MNFRNNLSYQFLKYVRPIWYFHLKPFNGGNIVWVDFEQLSDDEKELIQYDANYSNSILSHWDASYQALMLGIIKQTEKKEDNNIYDDGIALYPVDIYRFIRKYYKNIWSYVVFIQRLLSLYNPVNEFIGLWQTRKVNNINLLNSYFDYKNYPDFDSPLKKSNLLVTIIIPTYNRYEPLNNLLQDLEEQTYTNFEVILIDQSNQFYKDFYKQFNFNYHIIRQEQPALWRARNRGIKSAQSEYLLFLDDDSRVASDLISEHLKCLDYFQADISSGVSISRIGAKVPKNYSFFRWSDQLDTGNVLIKREVFEKCGFFDEQFEKMRMGDGEFGVRAYLNGFKNISNPKASRKHLKIAVGGLREMGHWDAFRPTNIFAPRPVASVLYFWRTYWGNKAAILSCFNTIPLSINPYFMKGKPIGNIISIFLLLSLFPLLFFQLLRSWFKSSGMIKRGAIIERL